MKKKPEIDALREKTELETMRGTIRILQTQADMLLGALQRLTHPAADDTDLQHALDVIRLVRR